MESRLNGLAIDPAELAAVRQRRVELQESLSALEQALACPAVGRSMIWGERVRSVLVEVADDFAEHIAVTEGPDGLHQAILAGDVRLANAVGTLTAEHAVIAVDLARLVADTEAPVSATEVAAVCERGAALLAALVRHRQRGADLIYEAYGTDIGGCE
jgi:hypothetical protein